MRPWANRRTIVATLSGSSVVAVAWIVLNAGPQAAQQAQPPKPDPDQPRATFRLGANYVRVDVYPTRNGGPVDDLQAADLELLEDGVPQKIEQFERVSIQQTVDPASRRDPNTVAESRAQAGDPRRRVFVVFLDTGMTTLEGSHAARTSVIDLLDRLIGDDDLFAVMTPDMKASGISFGRRTESIEAELATHWTWGQRDALVRKDPEEIQLETCFPDPTPEQYCMGFAGQMVKQPADAYHGVATQLIERRSEQRALSALDDLVGFLGAVREERKAVIVVSQGWRLLEPKAALTKLQVCDQAATPGPPGVSPGGRLVPDVTADRTGVGIKSNLQCQALASLYADGDGPSQLRQLIERANRFNVSFYPFDTRGFAVFDKSIAARDDSIRGDPGERSENQRGARGPMGKDVDRLANRVSSLRTLAEATDGLAIVNTNDLAGGARRIANDLSTYYLLGYQSTNTNLDGKWRAITVKVKTPGVQVRARKGYRALTEKELTLIRRGDTPPAAASTPAARSAEALAQLVGSLAGLDRALPWRSRAAWNSTAAPGNTRVWIASDIGEATLRQPEWAGGGTLTATITLADGKRLADTTIALAPGARALETSFDAAIPPSTEVTVRLRLSPTGGGLPLSDTLRFTPSGASTRLFRRGPTTGRDFLAAGDPQFRRSDRARVSVPIGDAAAAAVEATLLDRTGKALPIPVAARVETIDGGAWAIAEASLAALGPGDYVIRVVIGSGDAAATSLTAIRLVN